MEAIKKRKLKRQAKCILIALGLFVVTPIFNNLINDGKQLSDALYNAWWLGVFALIYTAVKMD